MAEIHSSAVVDRGAEIGADTVIGPYCVIGPQVVIAPGCRLVAHVHVSGRTTIGARTVIQPFASLGTPPQSVKYRGGATRLVIGSDCDLREAVTMNIGTEDGGGLTEVGDRCFFMVNAHVGHDCRVGNDVTFANNAVLGGHVVIGDHTFIGGQSAVHQFARVGEGAMISGVTGVASDVIPFGLTRGSYAYLEGLNIIGMRRRGFARAQMHAIRRAYRILFFGPGVFRDRVDAVATEFAGDANVAKVIAFIRAGKSRSLMMPRVAVAPADAGSGDGA
jgi:UDP-N-acetylglucosamine acyltransferase